MGFRINTNIAAMNAHRNATQTNLGLDKSLSSLSSGLRINVAADDASGMTIADSLRSQAQGLGQAVNNANDGVAVVQTADGALDEYISIINTVRTLSIQAASDGQNEDSRQAIQSQVDRLLEAANGIANQTQFNGQKLLDGTFTNKSFHIGAYAAETVNLSVGNVQTDSVGDIKSVSGAVTRTALDNTNSTETASGYVLKNEALTINDIDIAASLNTNTPNSLTDAKSIADAITDATGILAQGKTSIDGTQILGGTIDSANALEINGIAIADTTVTAGDADGALMRAINDISDQTGVTAAVENGTLTLTSKDGSNISVGGTSQAQVETLILEGTMETGDIYTSTIGGTAVSYTTVATDLDLDDVAAGLAAAINQNLSTGALMTATASTDGSGKVTLTAINDASATDITVTGGAGTNRSDPTAATSVNNDNAGVDA
ncbi:MAG: flagellin B, partial [Sulfurimonas sp.]|nr:flagellin B [Sulfurimonas sp.]